MYTFQKHKRHIGSGIHSVRIVFKACHIYGIGCGDIKLCLLAHSGRVKGGFHRPIMSEGCIILSSHLYGDEKQRYYYDRKMFKHHLYNDTTAVLLHKQINFHRLFIKDEREIY